MGEWKGGGGGRLAAAKLLGLLPHGDPQLDKVVPSHKPLRLCCCICHTHHIQSTLCCCKPLTPPQPPTPHTPHTTHLPHPSPHTQHTQHIQEDRLIQAMGLDNLTPDELRSAIKARGMRAMFGPGAEVAMRQQMQVGGSRNQGLGCGWLRKHQAG